MFLIRYILLYMQERMVRDSIMVLSSREKSYIYGVQLQGLYSTQKVHKPSPWSRHAHPYSHQMLCTDLITKMTKLILTRIYRIHISWYVFIVMAVSFYCMVESYNLVILHQRGCFSFLLDISWFRKKNLVNEILIARNQQIQSMS